MNIQNIIHKHLHKFIFSILISLIFLSNNYSLLINKYLYKNTISNMHIHYIDVGQGDAALIQVNNKNMLIDSGPSLSRNNIIDYLDKNHITKLDYIIATHPHEDHIGNMSYIINRYSVAKFYSPKVITTGKCFEDLVYSLKQNNLKINILSKNTSSINLGKDVSIDMYSPEEKTYDNLNNYSSVFKITYKNNSFLFTGDAESLIENKIIESNYDISCDVLKIGHHGSNTSTSSNFLNSANPSIAVISVGSYNDYGHPNKNTLKKLRDIKCTIYRTDIHGSIHLVSDGTTIKRL